MATRVYNKYNVKLIDGTEISIGPLKIKYLREFMDAFQRMHEGESEEDAINILTECVQIVMKQYMPSIADNIDKIEDNFDMPTIYKIVDIAAGVEIDKHLDDSNEPKSKNKDEDDTSWKNMDLAKLEAEIFTLGIWKDYEELESNLSMPELVLTLSVIRELGYAEKKFLAAIQGVNLDEENGENRGQKEWEDMKARVFSGGVATDSNDILALQGINAQKAGFGIGMGLDYEDAKDPALML